MSSASSASLEWTQSSNSFSDGGLEETLVPSECATTDIDLKGDSRDSSLFLTSSNATATTPSTAAAAWRVHASSGETLLHKERIHRYLDQCLPPALVDHQRATDGRLLAELCEALVQLGGPEVWATRLPTDVLRGSVLAQPVEEMETVDAKAEDGPTEDSTGEYRTDDAASTWEEDLRSVTYAETLPAAQVPWASLAHHLHQLTTRLSELITQHGQRSGAACYTLPFRLQARVTPLLYAWATCWRLAEADVDCWASVARAFLAACSSHPPPPPLTSTGSAAATAATKLSAAVDAASPASAVLSPASTDSATDAPYRRAPSSTAYARSTFTLPWKPLASLFLAVHEPSNALLPSWAAVVAVVRRELPALCRRAAPFFSPDAVEGLWGLVCGRLQRTPSGAEALSLLVHLVPYRHLCVPQVSNTDHAGDVEDAEEEEERTERTTAPRLTARAAAILRFLLVETATWMVPAPSSSSSSTSGHNRSRGRGSRRRGTAPLPLLLSWRAAVAAFVGSLARAHPALADMDAYAEPLFTAWLIALALPVGSSAGMVGASAAAAASRVVRGIGAAGAANGASGGGDGGVKGGEGFTAASYVQLLSAFPDNTDSSLWRQLERWIHATAVLVRPGLPCAPGSASARVCACYGGLAREALRRVSKTQDPPEPRSRGSEVRARSSSAASSAVSAHSAATATTTRPLTSSSRYWSVPTIDKFVQLFLPLAVSAFQTRAASSVNFLVTLLALSPTIVLPALLTCVDVGLHSPNEVAAQRRIAAKLLLHTVVTVFTDTPRQTSSALRSVRATVAEHVKASMMLWLSLVSASTPDVSSDVLTLLGVAVTYIPAPMLMESPYEAEALGTEYAARVVSLFTESETDSSQQQQAKPVRQKHVEALITALPVSARAMVTRVVLKEAHNRDYGQRMCPLVQMIAAVSSAEAWRFAQLTWLPVLLDAAAGDAGVRWAGNLLAACVVGCEDRHLVRRHAADILSAVNMQLRYLTSRVRRGVAVGLVNALVASLLRPRCDAAPENRTGKQLRNGGAGGERDGGSASAYMDEGSPLSDAPQDSSPAGGGVTARTGSASAAHVRVEWPTAEEDIRTCVDFFNASVRDVVRLIEEARQIRACSPATAAAVDSSSLAERFLPPAATTAAAPQSPSGQQRCASESAAEVTPHNVVEGALEWLGRLLEIFEWLYAVPSPPATIHTETAPSAADTAARRGVCWRDVNHRSAWWPGRQADTYKPAYSRAALFEVVYTHLCLPLVEHHVVKPLRIAGVELRPVFAPLLSLSKTLPVEEKEEESASDSVVEWGSVCGVLRWLVLSGIDCPQLLWLPRESSYRFWSRVVGANPASGRRASLPWAAWASRALSVHVDVAAAGYLPVSQDTLTRTVTLLQCLTLSPQKTVRTTSLRILVEGGLLASLDATSLALFVRRQRATTSAVLTRWHAVTNATTTNGGDGADDDDGEDAAAGSGGSSSRSALHTVQESISGTLRLFTFMSLRRLFVRCPWTELNVLTSLLTFPEVLRSTAVTTLLPWMQMFYERNPPVKSVTARCAAYMEAVVRLASALVTTHPVRSIFLLTLARSLYWPTPGTWLSLPVLRLLTRLTVSPHVAVRSRATELLSAVAVHVAVREPLVPVCLLPTAVEKGEGLLLVPDTFLLTPAAVTALDAAARALHDAQVQEVQSSLSRLSAVLPVLPSYLEGRGQLFPMCVLAVLLSAAEASGLPRAAPQNFASAQGSCVETPNFLDALAVAASEVPEDVMAFREQWDELLAGSPAAAAISSSPTHSSQDREPTDTANTATSWAVRMLTLPIERPMPGAAPEARPSTLVRLLASVACASPHSLRSVAALLAYAEERLRQWEAARAAQRDGAVRDVEDSDREGDSGGRGARHVEEDELYRLFLSVLTVAAAVVQLTTPPCVCDAHADLRPRALRLFTAVLMCLCSHAAVPHWMMESVMLLGIDSVKRSLSVGETWAVLSSVLEEPRGVAAAVDTPTVAATATGARDDAAGDEEEGGGGDVWSQRQLRLLTVAFTLLSAAPGVVKCALLPRLTALVSGRGRVFFMSPSDQVRRCAARLIRGILVMGAMQSGTLIEYTRCYSTGRTLLAQLLEKVNAQVFRGTLPFTTTTTTTITTTTKTTDDVREEGPASTAAPFVPATSAAAGAPAPSLFTTSSAEDMALLTTTALTIQAFPVDVYVDSLDDLVMLLCYSLDLSFTKVQHLHDAADVALLFLVTSSMPKAHAHRFLQHLCAICLGEVPYGVSRRAKAACTRALKAVAFRNLHRIGKYAMMLQVGDAALASLASRDASVRSEGSQLFAVLTKVASEAQTRVMVQVLGTECRMLTRRAAEATPTPMQSQRGSPLPHTQSAPMTLSDLSSRPSSPTASSPTTAAAAVAAEEDVATVMMDSVTNQSVGSDPANTRRMAVVQALGAAVLADPGTPSPYVPKLMEALASCAREGNTECGRFAKRVFEQWWHVHREGWEQEYKKLFSAEQVDAMSELLLAPRYYA